MHFGWSWLLRFVARIFGYIMRIWAIKIFFTCPFPCSFFNPIQSNISLKIISIQIQFQKISRSLDGNNLLCWFEESYRSAFFGVGSQRLGRVFAAEELNSVFFHHRLNPTVPPVFALRGYHFVVSTFFSTFARRCGAFQNK